MTKYFINDRKAALEIERIAITGETLRQVINLMQDVSSFEEFKRLARKLCGHANDCADEIAGILHDKMPGVLPKGSTQFAVSIDRENTTDEQPFATVAIVVLPNDISAKDAYKLVDNELGNQLH